MKRLLLVLLLSASFGGEAWAQASTCRVTTVAPTYLNNSTAPLSCETDGDQRITGAITGTVTANAGTNLNTSALALEASIQTAIASLSILDDWDESDRAKVNIIAGQAGITGGSGTVAANTPRVALATDSPGITTAGTAGVPASEVISVQGLTSMTPLQVIGAAGINSWTYAAAASGIANTTTAVTIKAADASLRNYVSSCQITSEALGAATEFAIRDGAGGTVLWRIKIGTAGIINGIGIVFTTPLKGTAATLLEVITLTASVTGAVYVNCQGFVAP